MNFYLTGIDYNGSTLEAREAVFRKRKAIEDFLAEDRFLQYAALSTCNRFEIYAASDYSAAADMCLKKLLERFPEFLKYGYFERDGLGLFRHLVRLASGLESQIKGEMQILEQLEGLLHRRSFPKRLFGLWNNAISLGRYIRLEAGLNDTRRNIAAVVFEDILRNADHDRKIEVAVIGTGKVAGLFAVNSRAETRVSFFANKNYPKARELAGLAGGEALHLEDIERAAARADVIISATKSPHFVLNDKIGAALRGRKTPIYLYDLAVPRDIDPAIGRIDNVILKTPEDLAGLFQDYNMRVKDRLKLAEYLVEEAIKNSEGNFYEADITYRDAAEPVGVKAG